MDVCVVRCWSVIFCVSHAIKIVVGIATCWMNIAIVVVGIRDFS